MKLKITILFLFTYMFVFGQDKKISQLPIATIPLSGNELTAVVQNGVTDQTTVANFLSSFIQSGIDSIWTNGKDTVFWLKNSNTYFALIDTFTVQPQWSLVGNSITNSNFIGTINQRDFRFRSGNVYMGRLGCGAIDQGIEFGPGSSATGSVSSVAIGNSCLATGSGGTALGVSCVSGGGAFSAGASSLASGDYSIAIGNGPTASANHAIALGNGCRATGVNSLAMVVGAVASGVDAVSIGSADTSAGTASFTCNDHAKAVGDISFVSGHFNRAASYVQTVVGQYNDTTGDYAATSGSWITTDKLFSIGNSNLSSARSTAFEVLKNGNIKILSPPNGVTGDSGLVWTASDKKIKKRAQESRHFVPVFSDSSNVDAISSNIDAMWIQIGDLVTCQYSVLVNPTTTLTDTYSAFTLPSVAANPSASVAGQGGFQDTGGIKGVFVTPVDATHGVFHFTPTTTSNTLVQFSITYRVN